MEESEVETLSTSSNLEEVSQVLEKFNRSNENAFSFPNLCENDMRAILWTALFQHIQNKQSAPIHSQCMMTVRILSRDKTGLDNLLCEKWITTLVERAGLYNFLNLDDESCVVINLPEREVAVEAMKCLSNLTYNSEVARALCAHTDVAQGLVSRLRVYKDIPYKEEIMLFDMKLLVILTALRQDIKIKIRDELHGMDYLISCLNEIVQENTQSQDIMMMTSTSSGPLDEGLECYLNDQQHVIVCEILKAQFNLIMQSDSDEPTEEDEAMYLKLMPVLTALFYTRASTFDKLMELHSNIANLLTSVPPVFYKYLTPDLAERETAKYVYDGKNMDALQSLLALLQHRLTITTNTKNQYENLSPILTVLIKSARGSNSHRKYLRLEVLPPLRDVSLPPEKGTTLRNQLCRLLTTPVMSVRDLVAEFLFILCKEKVGRLVKYTGFGNAAGHLAQRGLLGAPAAAASSSSDSDTEEYRRARPLLDPVRGCTRPAHPHPHPHRDMTDEQKEYEAMKLVNLFDKLVSAGVVRPARVGPDGRPHALDHVMELRDPRDPPNRPQS